MTTFKNSDIFPSHTDISMIKHISEILTTDKSIVFHERYLGLKESEQKKMRILNKHLLPSNTPVEGKFQLPKVSPYTGNIPEIFVPYNAKVCLDSAHKGIYCNIHDSAFNSTWTQPIKGLKKVKRYKVAVAPDHTLWLDGLTCENIEQLRKSRTTQIFWQNNGSPQSRPHLGEMPNQLRHTLSMAWPKTVGPQLGISAWEVKPNKCFLISQYKLF